MNKTPGIALLSVTCFICFGNFIRAAGADPYHRFWRGTKLSSMSSQEFEDGLNETFISRTIQTGSGHGLIAYQPVLVGSDLDTPTTLPDEIALVSYQDQASYNALRSTPEGQASLLFTGNTLTKPGALASFPKVLLETSRSNMPTICTPISTIGKRRALAF